MIDQNSFLRCLQLKAPSVGLGRGDHQERMHRCFWLLLSTAFMTHRAPSPMWGLLASSTVCLLLSTISYLVHILPVTCTGVSVWVLVRARILGLYYSRWYFLELSTEIFLQISRFPSILHPWVISIMIWNGKWNSHEINSLFEPLRWPCSPA